jgi:hypothetical protein
MPTSVHWWTVTSERLKAEEEAERLAEERWWAAHMRARFGKNWREEAKRRGLPTR